MDNDVAAALLGRVMAQGTAVETLLALFLQDKPEGVRHALFQTLRSAQNDPGPKDRLGDDAAIFISDARVHAGQAMEQILARTDALLAGQGRQA